jgi:hypothetical protein
MGSAESSGEWASWPGVRALGPARGPGCPRLRLLLGFRTQPCALERLAGPAPTLDDHSTQARPKRCGAGWRRFRERSGWSCGTPDRGGGEKTPQLWPWGGPRRGFENILPCPKRFENMCR